MRPSPGTAAARRQRACRRSRAGRIRGHRPRTRAGPRALAAACNAARILSAFSRGTDDIVTGVQDERRRRLIARGSIGGVCNDLLRRRRRPQQQLARPCVRNRRVHRDHGVDQAGNVGPRRLLIDRVDGCVRRQRVAACQAGRKMAASRKSDDTQACWIDGPLRRLRAQQPHRALRVLQRRVRTGCPPVGRQPVEENEDRDAALRQPARRLEAFLVDHHVAIATAGQQQQRALRPAARAEDRDPGSRYTKDDPVAQPEGIVTFDRLFADSHAVAARRQVRPDRQHLGRVGRMGGIGACWQALLRLSPRRPSLRRCPAAGACGSLARRAVPCRRISG